MNKLNPILIHRTEKTAFGDYKQTDKAVLENELKQRVREVVEKIQNEVDDLTLLQMRKIMLILKDSFLVDETENYKKLCEILEGKK